MDLPLPVVGFPRSNSALQAELMESVRRVVESGQLVLADEVAGFETEFASWCGAEHSVGVASGTDAIELALRALGIGEGDEVVTQANTCVPTVAGIERAGATPVLCDVEPDAATMDPESLAGALSERTRAVIPVHLYGQCADVEKVTAVAEDVGAAVVEDCAQAHGARYRGAPAGALGVLGCFSFYPTKNLGALGDGGAVTCADPDLAERLRSLRQYGQRARYEHLARGVNSRLDELQAALLRRKLPHLDEWNERRRRIAKHYEEALLQTPVSSLATFPDREHVYHQFAVLAPERDRFRERLGERGVPTLVHYPLPIHRQPAYSAIPAPMPLSNAEMLSEKVVSLPVFPELSDAEVEHVAASAVAAA